MNSKGQIIITDLFFYLIIVTIILSIVIYSFSMINDNQVENIQISTINQVLEDFTQTLMSEGIPDNWNENNEIIQIGLAVNNNSNKISYQKLKRLKENTYLLDKYFPEGIKYSVYLEPINKSQEEINIIRSDLGKNVYHKTRTVILDYGYEITPINSEIICSLNHTENYNCIYLNINKTSLNEGKYYMVSKNNINYSLSNTYNEIITSNDNELNNNFNQLLHEDEDTICIHISNNNETYLVYDKFNQRNNLNSVLNPDIYVLHVEVST